MDRIGQKLAVEKPEDHLCCCCDGSVPLFVKFLLISHLLTCILQNAPPRLESFTVGGLGPDHAVVLEKDKAGSLPLQCWSSFRNCCRRCNPSVNDGVYYMDHFNDLSYSCSVGTSDDHGVWMNQSDPAGTIMSCLVWFLMGYSALTMTFLAQTGGIPVWASVVYGVLSSLALATHAKTSLTDPGSVPASAVPTEAQRRQHTKLSMCSQCQTFKPPGSHHCRICNRCISRMDHQYVFVCLELLLLYFLLYVAAFSLWLLYISPFCDSCPWMNSECIICVIRAWMIVVIHLSFVTSTDSTTLCFAIRLRRSWQFETFSLVFDLYLDLRRLFPTAHGIQLLFLRRRILRL